MSHEIDKTYDRTFSVAGTEWHGLAIVTPKITEETLKPLFAEIRRMQIVGEIDGEIVQLEGHNAIVADYGACRPDLVGARRFTPLHVPKISYTPITNRAIFDCVTSALEGVDAQVTTAGTLRAGRNFYVSVELLGDSRLTINGDAFRAYLNFGSAHDGSMNFRAWDSMTRIVCMNTFQAAMNGAGELDLRVRHTKNSPVALDNVSDLISSVLSGRAALKEQLEEMAAHPLRDTRHARELAAGYFAISQGAPETFATRTINAIDEIARLTERGLGNSGKTLYDVFNGATEYWTGGNGTGVKASGAQKLVASHFGAAADHKKRFGEMLLGTSAELESAREIGRETLAASA